MIRFAASLAAAVALSMPAAAEVWDMPTPYSDKVFHTQNVLEFAKDVERLTNGKIKINVHSAGSLYPHPEIKNAVRSRQVPIGEFFLSRLSNEDPAFGMDSLPFLATSYPEAEKLWAAQKPVVAKLLEKQGLMPLYAVPWPPQGLYTKKPVNSVNDLSGLRFRAYNAILEDFAKRAGAQPVQVEAPNIPQAFSTGQVEAMITSPSTGVSSKAWDFVDYYTPINAWIPKNIVVINKRVFDSLDPDTQKAILEAAAKAEKRGWEMSKAETEAKTKILAENGMKVNEPSPELMAGLKQIGADMLEDWKANASPEAKAALDAYLASK